MRVISPLRVKKNKKKDFILNLNNYRNAHYHTLNKAKQEYKECMAHAIEVLPKMQVIKIHYRLFPATKRKTDIGNVIAIHKKFFEDALVELGKLPDDTYEHVVESSESFGMVDTDYPRVEITITQLE